MQTYRFALAVSLLAVKAFGQTSTSAPPLSALPRNFYHDYELVPIGNGEKLLLTLQGDGQKVNVVVEPVAAKDGGPVTQYVAYANGAIMLYTKTTVTLPAPDGGAGAPVEGLAVSNVSTGPALPAQPPAQPGHQSTSRYTTLPKKSHDFKLPIRMDRAGFGIGRPRVWLLWDGKTEVQVEPVDTKFDNKVWSLPGFGNHLKFVSNVSTEGSEAPRFFYLKHNKDDSITVYGDDDMQKLKTIDEAKDKK